MLILARKVEQRIQIGPDITITVLKIRTGAVKIGIEAPDGTPVFRSELLARHTSGLAATSGSRRPTAVADGASQRPRATPLDAGTSRDARTAGVCEDDDELPLSHKGATVKIGPGTHLARQRNARSPVAPFRYALPSADPLDELPAVTAVG